MRSWRQPSILSTLEGVTRNLRPLKNDILAPLPSAIRNLSSETLRVVLVRGRAGASRSAARSARPTCPSTLRILGSTGAAGRSAGGRRRGGGGLCRRGERRGGGGGLGCGGRCRGAPAARGTAGEGVRAWDRVGG